MGTPGCLGEGGRKRVGQNWPQPWRVIKGQKNSGEPPHPSPAPALEPCALERMAQTSRLQGPPLSKAKTADSLGHGGSEHARGGIPAPWHEQTLTVEAAALGPVLLPVVSPS